ncbi:protein saal1 [Strongylocentrotus purpuratus]|uniref:Protein saal1 n=1 Tax=Strongylocentrotus purpuratus TaxID=7668 RepID=A0A7M7P1C3_STRPU|nr:protein saal1 [Strongylocentrotus purpuratus]
MELTSKDSPILTGDSPQRPLTSEDVPIRNPSPPPEGILTGEDKSLLEADTIQNTMFSKHWVFSILMKLLQQVEKEKNLQTEVDAAEEHDGIDIDEELENELCRLWDMTANVEVAKFLQEWKSPDIFLSVISKTNAPRITEICMGVLGNMACRSDIRREFSKNQQLIDLSFGLMSGSDAPTMVEASRLIYTCLNDEESAPRWLETVKKDGDVLRSVTFILQSSTNSDLIHNVADLLDQLLDLDDGLLQVWSGPVLIQAITEALNQISSDRVNTLSLLHHSLQVISTTDSGIDGLVELSEKVHPLVSSFICDVFEDGVLSMRGRENTLASVISVLSVMVLRSRDVSKRLAQKESRTIKHLTEMLYIIHRKEASPSSRKLPTNQDAPPAAPAHPNNNHRESASSDKQEPQKRDGGRGDGISGGGGDGCHGDRRKEEEEENQEKVWLTELLKDQLIDFFCCILEVAKKDKALQQRLHACGPKRLQAIADCLPEDRNDLSDLMGNIQGKS